MPHSSGRVTHLTDLVNPPDESVHDLVTPPSLPCRAPPLHRTPACSLPEGLSLTASERKGKGKVSSLRETSNQDTNNSQNWERNKLNPYKLTYGELSEDGEPEDFEYLVLTEEEGDIEILHPNKTNKEEKVREGNESLVQSLEPEK